MSRSGEAGRRTIARNRDLERKGLRPPRRLRRWHRAARVLVIHPVTRQPVWVDVAQVAAHVGDDRE